MFPEGLTTMFELAPATVFEADFSVFGEPWVPSKRVSVGVGGVTVVTGVSMSAAGGVEGRILFSRLGIELV